MVVLCPGDPWEVRGALREAMKQDRPVYIRMGKKGEANIHKDVPADFAIGKALVVHDGTDVCLLSTGNMLPEAIEALISRLRGQGHQLIFRFRAVATMVFEWRIDDRYQFCRRYAAVGVIADKTIWCLLCVAVLGQSMIGRGLR